MPDTKLIMVDGLSGAGKSTNAQWIALQLRRNRIPNRWIFEADVHHPLMWYRFWTGTRLVSHNYDTPARHYTASSIAAWMAFASTQQSLPETYVIEAFPFLNTIGLMIHADPPLDVLRAYIHEVYGILAGLKARLIHLIEPDVPANLRRICAMRPGFEAALLRYMEQTPYFRNKGLQGTAGLEVLWQAKYDLIDELVADYPAPRLTIDITAGEWPHYRQQMLAWLGLQHVDDASIVPPDMLNSHAGEYGTTQQNCTVWQDGEYLYMMEDGIDRRLLPLDVNTFWLEGKPVTLRFAADVLHIDRTVMGAGMYNLPRQRH